MSNSMLKLAIAIAAGRNLAIVLKLRSKANYNLTNLIYWTNICSFVVCGVHRNASVIRYVHCLC